MNLLLDKHILIWLLIWQAIHNNMMFMSHDADIQSYQKIGLKIF